MKTLGTLAVEALTAPVAAPNLIEVTDVMRARLAKSHASCNGSGRVIKSEDRGKTWQRLFCGCVDTKLVKLGFPRGVRDLVLADGKLYFPANVEIDGGLPRWRP
jgi:hypothetical protein